MTVRPTFFCLVLIAAVTSPPAFANAGATSAGVTTTTGNSTDPSADVQSQSAGFVQQNQQLQNAQSPNGAAATSSTVAGAVAPVGATGAGNASDADAAQQAQAAGTAAAAPAVPPPPPPTYESTMRRLDRRAEAAPASAPTVIASGPPGAVRKQEPAEPAKSRSAPAPAPSTSATPPVANTATGRTDDVEHVRLAPVVSGGRGEAPDGFTFFSGVTIAGALLAFAFATYLRMGRSEP
jgi:hypothetical protein